LLKVLGGGQGYLKAGFLGWQKSGKTYTATLLANGLWKHFGLKSPIAFFDTEGGSEYVGPLVKKATGLDMVGIKSRSLSDLIVVGHECVREGIQILIVDSITHPWAELLDSYLKSINKLRAQKNQPPRSKLELNDWGPIKREWEPWTNFYLNSPLHIIICGRAGDIWEREQNEETGKMENVKTGIKMKTEGQFGYEPSVLFMMEQEQVNTAQGLRVTRRITCIGDRFGELSGLDGTSAVNPGFEYFLPHVKLLNPKAHTTIATETSTDLNLNDDGDGEWARERRARTIFSEEIQGLLVAHYPGKDADSMKKKADLIFKYLNTRSWTQVESSRSEVLKAALSAMRQELEPPTPEAPVDAPEGKPNALFGDNGKPVTAPAAPATEAQPSGTAALTLTIRQKIKAAKTIKALKERGAQVAQLYKDGILTEADNTDLTGAIMDREAALAAAKAEKDAVTA
jgi:hypothetical protein